MSSFVNSIRKVLVPVVALCSLFLLVAARPGWADSLADGEVIQKVREVLQGDPAFMGQMVGIVPADNGQRALVVSFKGAPGAPEDQQMGLALLKGLIAGGAASLSAEKRVHYVFVLFLGNEKKLGFGASTLDIALLLAGAKTPEGFLRKDLQVVDIDKVWARSE